VFSAMRLVLLVPALAVTAGAQQPPTRTLSRPAVEYDEPFSGLASLRELRDGRLIVTDLRDKTLQLIDLANGSATPIGREGSGPTEWGLPTSVLAMPGDSTYVVDILNSRFLVVGPDGKPVKTFSPAADAAMQTITRGSDGGRGGRGGAARGGARAGGATMTFGGGMMQARATDARGRMYYTGMAFALSDDGMPRQADSLPLLRQSPGSTAVDTVAYVMPSPNGASVSGSRGGGMRFSVGGGRPFENGDAWVVFPDGRVAIARAADYRVDIVQPNKTVVRGAAVPYTPVRVTEAEKRQWREAQQNSSMIAVTMNARGGAAPQRSVQSGVGRPVQEPDSWPEVKSPFAGNSVFAAPSGETWVFRQRAANDRVPVADVFNARGQLVGRVALPAGIRVVALGLRGVYAVRTDEDDLQYLQRYALQW
jgi:hypothetical protein